MPYYEILITETGKSMGRSQEDYQILNYETKKFLTKEEVKDFLRERYGTCKKEKIYADNEETGDPVHVGWIYCFKNYDVSHGGPAWYQQDWVEVRETTAVSIII